MNLAEFKRRYNEEAEKMAAETIILSVLSEGRATALYCGKDVSLVVGEPEDVGYVQVISGLPKESSLMGLQAYCVALSVLTGCTPEVRKGWLERLGLFDGRLAKFGANGLSTNARGWELSVKPYNPGKQLISYIAKRKKGK